MTSVSLTIKLRNPVVEGSEENIAVQEQPQSIKAKAREFIDTADALATKALKKDSPAWPKSSGLFNAATILNGVNHYLAIQPSYIGVSAFLHVISAQWYAARSVESTKRTFLSDNVLRNFQADQINFDTMLEKATDEDRPLVLEAKKAADLLAQIGNRSKWMFGMHAALTGTLALATGALAVAHLTNEDSVKNLSEKVVFAGLIGGLVNSLFNMKRADVLTERDLREIQFIAIRSEKH